MPSFQHHVDLTSYNTFGIHVAANQFCALNAVEDAIELFKAKDLNKDNVLIMGGGSNMLFTTPEYAGLVVLNKIEGIDIIHEDEDYVTVKVGSGENWHKLVLHAISNDWGGIENLSLIPGTVGAAPMQNIGAYGVEVREVIQSVEALHLESLTLEHFSNADCQFGYRDSYFKNSGKGKYFISSVTFRLTKRNHKLRTSYGAIQQLLTSASIDQPTIKDISDAVVAIRSSKLPDPKKIGNAGSFFKNPSIDHDQFEAIIKNHPLVPSYPGENGLIKTSAAWLIEQCGFKGMTRENIGVHKEQALVLVNYGNGKGSDVWNLALEIQDHVEKKFGIRLHPEVNIIR